ncbi:gliding motility protein GldN [Membranihabitans maritimus]|uniref:type IX secretion system ring protein PorN/GldN n=1 Tax=Membranihabitans maritimus TaxID=2904244 RepID=UPI001F23137D|nr:gliding motility protein GldN [Membranihabitans maritimus]
MKYLMFILTFAFTISLRAQIAEEIITESSEDEGIAESPLTSQSPSSSITPVDGLAEGNLMKERMVMDYAPIREGDIFWSKYIWGIIDVREKINQPFVYPKSPFFQLLVEGIQSGAITPYIGDSDDFTKKMEIEAVNNLLYSVDTAMVQNPETFELEPVITRNDKDFSDIKKFRIKEIWYFDKLHSRMRARILGISPIEERVGEENTFSFELPLFWIYWPEARDFFASKKVYLPGNDATILSWDDYMEMRYFNYYIIKESNVRDYRLKDFPSMSGDSEEAQLRRMMESKKIKEAIFNYESDMWSY